MNIRLAKEKDIPQLIKMRWDFTIEHDESKKNASFSAFHQECQSFLENAIRGDQWFIWVAEEEDTILSHIYLELIQKVPRPGRTTFPFVFMTNVYTAPAFRNKGVGSQLLGVVNIWLKENNYEFSIVWPSDDSVEFYKRNGYEHCQEAMEFHP